MYWEANEFNSALAATASANPIHNTVTAPEQSGAAAFSDLFVRAPIRKPRVEITPNRVCRVCLVEKPLKSFIKTKNLSGRGTLCHSCKAKAPSHIQSLVNWRNNNRDKIAGYNRKSREIILASRPTPTPCQCGNHTKFRWLAGKWNCAPCQAARAKQNRARWKRERCSRRTRKARIARMSARWGERVGQALQQLIADGQSQGCPVWKIIRKSLPKEYWDFKKDAILRIDTLNALSKKPRWNVGWLCSTCPEHSFDHRFFDLDHIHPRHKKGSNRRHNLQILCPNCHRRKTMQDVRGSGEITPAELDASVLNKADAPSLNNTPKAEASALCGEPRYAGFTAQDSVGIS